MPGTGATADVLRQLGRVRRRHNALALQRLLYGLLATAATCAAMVLLLALRATPTAFTAGSVLALAGLGAAALVLGRATARRWLGRAHAAAWVDRSAGLDGRLLTLSQVDAGDDEAFVALLERQTLDGLPAWAPERVVPRPVPWRALAAAVGAMAMLALVMSLAPQLRPTSRRLLVSDRPMDWIAAGDTAGDGPEDLLVAPGTGHAPADGTTVAPGDDAGAPSALQDWLQRAVAGEQAWEVGGASLAARAPTAERPGAQPSGDGSDVAAGTTGDDGVAPTDADDDLRRTLADATNGGGSAPGAGDGTDPRLFGTPAAAGDAARDHFELAIAARVRTRQGGPDTPHGDVPPAEPDRHPALATSGRPDDPIHRMPVPAAYEALVRRLYARCAGGPEPSP